MCVPTADKGCKQRMCKTARRKALRLDWALCPSADGCTSPLGDSGVICCRPDSLSHRVTDVRARHTALHPQRAAQRGTCASGPVREFLQALRWPGRRQSSRRSLAVTACAARTRAASLRQQEAASPLSPDVRVLVSKSAFALEQP